MEGNNSTIVDEKRYIEEILTKVKDTIGLTDYEVSVLRETMRVLQQPAPDTYAAAFSRIKDLDKLRSILSNMIYMLSEKYTSRKVEYLDTYDKKYAAISKIGRLNGQTIESEIHSGDPLLRNQRLLLENFDNFKNLLASYIKNIDISKSSAMLVAKVGSKY